MIHVMIGQHVKRMRPWESRIYDVSISNVQFMIVNIFAAIGIWDLFIMCIIIGKRAC